MVLIHNDCRPFDKTKKGFILFFHLETLQASKHTNYTKDVEEFPSQTKPNKIKQSRATPTAWLTNRHLYLEQPLTSIYASPQPQHFFFFFFLEEDGIKVSPPLIPGHI